MTTTTTITKNKAITITTTKEINAKDFFEAITGSDFYGCSDFTELIGYNENTLTVSVKYYDIDTNPTSGYWKVRNKKLTLEKLVTAYAELLDNNSTHCGGHSLDHNKYDGCFAYFVLQQALYGKIEF